MIAQLVVIFHLLCCFILPACIAVKMTAVGVDEDGSLITIHESTKDVLSGTDFAKAMSSGIPPLPMEKAVLYYASLQGEPKTGQTGPKLAVLELIRWKHELERSPHKSTERASAVRKFFRIVNVSPPKIKASDDVLEGSDDALEGSDDVLVVNVRHPEDKAEIQTFCMHVQSDTWQSLKQTPVMDLDQAEDPNTQVQLPGRWSVRQAEFKYSVKAGGTSQVLLECSNWNTLGEREISNYEVMSVHCLRLTEDVKDKEEVVLGITVSKLTQGPLSDPEESPQVMTVTAPQDIWRLLQFEVNHWNKNLEPQDRKIGMSTGRQNARCQMDDAFRQPTAP